MPITPRFTPEDIQRQIEKSLRIIEEEQIIILQKLGEMCVTRAREIPKDIGFEDQTGNLRSSIGYTVFKNGIALHEFYEQVAPKHPKKGAVYDGAQKGAELARKVGAKYKQGIALVVTAGMSYAIYVESGGDRKRTKKDGSVTTWYQKPRDVLTSAELLAKKELPRMIEELKQDIEIASGQ
jgi:hypothetical protein